MKILFFILITGFPFFTGKQTPGVSLFLETGSGRELIAFQQTG